jgi:hypothetical protein
VRHIFQDVFAPGLRELSGTRDLSEDDVRTAIKNSAGVAGTLLIPQVGVCVGVGGGGVLRCWRVRVLGAGLEVGTGPATGAGHWGSCC